MPSKAVNDLVGIKDITKVTFATEEFVNVTINDQRKRTFIIVFRILSVNCVAGTKLLVIVIGWIP